MRDTLLMALEPGTRKVDDWDLCTDAEPREVSRLFKKVIETGIAHGTVTILLGGESFEVTTLRGERGHSDGRHPDEVFFVQDLNEDLARRDFTINAMAYDVLENTFFDPFDGLADLKAKRLRAVGDPATRFAEDGLRVLRCARFCATLGFEIEEETRTAISLSLDSFRKVANERVRDEWFKALSSRAPSLFLDVVCKEGLLAITAPPFAADEVRSRWTGDLLAKVDQAHPDPLLRLALLCVVLGEVDAEKTARLLSDRLRLSRQQAGRLAALCLHAQLPRGLLHHPTPQAARAYLRCAQRELYPDLEHLQCLTTVPSERPLLDVVHQLLRAEIAAKHPLSTKELAIGGKELIDELGFPKGPAIGQVLDELLQAVLDDPTRNEREILLDLARSKNPLGC